MELLLKEKFSSHKEKILLQKPIVKILLQKPSVMEGIQVSGKPFSFVKVPKTIFGKIFQNHPFLLTIFITLTTYDCLSD